MEVTEPRSVNIPESCDFRAQFDPLNIIFLSAYTFWMKVLNKQIRKLKDCWIIEQYTFDFK